jgi:hypothetical protein
MYAGVALGTTVLNWLWVEPVNTKLMFDRYALENDKGSRDEAKITQIKKDFGKWHGFSSVLNLAGLCGVLAHGWWLGSRLTLLPVWKHTLATFPVFHYLFILQNQAKVMVSFG